ncbi:MAG: hypothetical protein ABMA26_06195 [Limisphaerales bacterium]
MKPSLTVLTADIHRLYARFGPDTLLVEADPRHPRFRLAVAGLPTLAESLADAHQLCLAEGDIAVALGKASDGLNALGFADKVKLDKFIADNPALRGACRVEHSGFTALLLRVDGAAPASRGDGAFMWLSNGSTLTVLMRARRGWQAFPPGKPLVPVPRVRLDKLDWRALGVFGQTLLRDVLTQQNGGPFRSSVAAQGRLNLGFWTAFLPRVMDVRYHASRRQFQQRPAGAPRWVDVSPATVARLTSDAVSTFTTQWLTPYRPTPCETQRLVARLRQATTVEVPDGQSFFAACVRAAVERHDGSDVTTKEALATIEVLHCQHGLAMPSKMLGEQWLKRCIREFFGVPCTNNCSRKKKCKRGYRTVRIRTSVLSVDALDALDALDASPRNESSTTEESGSRDQGRQP